MTAFVGTLAPCRTRPDPTVLPPRSATCFRGAVLSTRPVRRRPAAHPSMRLPISSSDDTTIPVTPSSRQPQNSASPSSPVVLPAIALAAATLAATTPLPFLSCSHPPFTPAPALAEYPDTAPESLFFDEAGVVPKASSVLAQKALVTMQTRLGYTVHFVVAKSLPYETSPEEFAHQLFEAWKAGPSDIVVVGGTRIARAGVVAGSEAAKKLTPEICASMGNETYAMKAGAELYGGAVLDVNNRLIPVLSGEADPGPPKVEDREAVQTYKTKAETKASRGKYVKIVGAVLLISFVAPIIQTLWYIK